MSERYEVSETPHGWRVFKTFGNGGSVGKPVRTRELAEAAMARLDLADAKRSAFSDARSRARNQCECAGECGDAHGTARWARIGGDASPGLGSIALQVIVVDRDADNLHPDNLRVVCQLCRQHYDAAAFGGAALFEISG
ncbi:MAG: hypothetical protein KDB47_12275 [Mycobacterium sp.]|nr:hypothetical protein [Mycobacterium sp.]